MIAAALVLNSVIFSALAMNFLAVTCGYHWPTMLARLLRDWKCAVIMASCGFLLLLLIPVRHPTTLRNALQLLRDGSNSNFPDVGKL